MLIVFYIMMITQDETIKLKKLFSIVVKQEGEAAEGVGGRMKRQLFQQRSRDNDLPHAVDTIDR